MGKCIAGSNDLATVNADLAKEWDYRENKKTPETIAAHSKEKVWWIGKCGHKWDAVVDSRMRGRGCPYCAGKRILPGFNDLVTKAEEVAKEWDYDKNQKDPTKTSPGSHEYAWWICSKCGTSWYAEIRGRVKGNRCPECFKNYMSNKQREIRLKKGISLKEANPWFLKEWSDENDISPDQISAHSKHNASWKCSICGHKWKALIENRMRGSGCPACAGHIIVKGNNDFETNYPEFIKEWDFEKNNPLLPSSVYKTSGVEVWWKCQYGHSYSAIIHDRITKHTGCPECSKRWKTSFAEQAVYFYLKRYFPDAINRYSPDYMGSKEIDIYIPSEQLGIEYDGGYYHTSVTKDRQKDLICKEHGVTLIRIREPKCKDYDRSDPTFHLSNLNDDELSCVISQILIQLNRIPDVDIKRDKIHILEIYEAEIKSNSLANYPKLAMEWHPLLNGTLKPENILAIKNKEKYFWKCQTCGHEWQASLGERLSGSGCPVCKRRIIISGKNDLLTTHPDIAKEWVSSDNGLQPENVSFGSNERVLWKCSKCGHMWSTRVTRRIHGQCPACQRKELAKERSKSVYQYTREGEFIKEYESASIASKALGISNIAIHNACNPNCRQQFAGGYLWKYKEDEAYSQ